MFTAAISGFATGFSLILAIGAQNAFVLRQGIKGEHVLPLVLFCSVSDAILVALGVAGFGTVVSSFPNLATYMAWAGAAFLFVYGASRFMSSFKGEYTVEVGPERQSLKAVLALAAAFTWANPHVYLDTFALLGAVSTTYTAPMNWVFGSGAILASFVFFFSLGYGARLLAPFMNSPQSWRILDGVIGVIMWIIAIMLLRHAI